MQAPFEGVVRAHGSTVLRVCRALAGPHDADDAWSETFLSALRAWPDLPEDANVAGWLVTIARNKCLDLHRSTARRADPVADLPTLPVRGPVVGGVGAAAMSADPSEQLPDEPLWAALAALSPRQRECVTLHHVAGMRHTEVAVLLDISPAAARRASADGIAALRTTYRSGDLS